MRSGTGVGFLRTFVREEQSEQACLLPIPPPTGESDMGLHPLPLGESFEYDANGRPRGYTHDCDGFNRVGSDRHGINRAGCDTDRYCRDHQHVHGVFVGHDGCDAPHAAASGVDGSQTGVGSGGQCASSGGNAARTVRAEAPAGMASEVKMSSR